MLFYQQFKILYVVRLTRYDDLKVLAVQLFFLFSVIYFSISDLQNGTWPAWTYNFSLQPWLSNKHLVMKNSTNTDLELKKRLPTVNRSWSA